MQVIAKATVARVETLFPRTIWDEEAQGIIETDVITFYLDDSNEDEYLFIADCNGEYIFSDKVEEIPEDWLDAKSLKFYFKATVEEFTSPGFLECYFAE